MVIVNLRLVLLLAGIMAGYTFSAAFIAQIRFLRGC